MLRLIRISPFFSFSTVPPTPAQVKYLIKNKAYLIVAPPKRPLSGWTLYTQQQLAGKKNLKVTVQMQALGKRWKSYAEIREKYNKLAEERNQGYAKLKEEYEKTYQLPFKKISGHNLRLKKLFTDNKVITKQKNIQSIGKQVKALFQEPRTLKEDEEFKAEAKRISEERQSLKKKFQFPKLQHPTLQSYRLKHSIPVDQRGPTYDEDIRKGFQNHVASWKAEVDKWLIDNKYQITFQQFQKLYKKATEKKKDKGDDQ